MRHEMLTQRTFSAAIQKRYAESAFRDACRTSRDPQSIGGSSFFATENMHMGPGGGGFQPLFPFLHLCWVVNLG